MDDRDNPVDTLLVEREISARAEQRRMVASVIAGFAHEVRNPLAAILSLTESALAELQERGIAVFGLERVPVLIHRIDQLLKLALSYGNPSPPLIEPLHIPALVRTALDAVEAARHLPRPQFELRMEEQLAWVLADASQSTAILTNLLNNALDAVPAGGKISVHAELCNEPGLGPRELQGPQEQPFVGISIVDEGRGIPPEVRGRIFDPFFTTKARGTGLGLAVSRDLARLNGGDLLLLSTSQRGSEFRLLLRKVPRT